MALKRIFKLVLCGAVLIVGVLPFLLPVSASLPDKADAIVVLGGGSGDRVAKSLQLFESGYAPRMVLTGADPSAPHGQNEIEDERTKFLVKNQVSPTKIFYAFPSSNTWQEAGSILELMSRMGWGRVIVVSDPPHMLRLSYTWKKIFRDHPQEFILVQTEPIWWSTPLWWKNETSFSFAVSEIAKLAYYLVAY